MKEKDKRFLDIEQALEAEPEIIEIEDSKGPAPEASLETRTDSQLAKMLKEDKLDTVRLSRREMEKADTVVLPKTEELKCIKAMYQAGKGRTDKFRGIHTISYAVRSIGARQSYDPKEGFELKEGDYLIAQVLELVVADKMFNLVKQVELNGKEIQLGYCIPPYKVERNAEGLLTAVPAPNVGFKYFSTFGDMFETNPEAKGQLTQRQRAELLLKLQLYKWVSKDNLDDIKVLLIPADAQPQQISYQPAGKITSSEEWLDFRNAMKQEISAVKLTPSPRDSTRILKRGNRLSFE